MRRLALMFAMILPMATLCEAQRAGLSGQWKLSQAKSFLAGDHPPSNYTLILDLKLDGESLSQTLAAANEGNAMYGLPRGKSTMQVAIDGKAHDVTAPDPFPGMPESHVSISAEWQGDMLFVIQSGAGFGGYSTSHRRYFLSEDKAELIELIEGHSTFGDVEQRLVFEKQP